MASDSKLKSNPWVSKFAQLAPYGRFYLGSLLNYAKIDTDVIVPALQNVEYGRQPAATALAAAAKQMNSLLH